MKYIALIHKENNDFVSIVPDLNHTSTYADTFEQCVEYTKEACELYCDGLDRLPKPSTYEQLQNNGEAQYDNAIPQVVDIKVEKNIRINVMISSSLLKEVDEKAKLEFHSNRSAYFQELAKRDLQLAQ